MSKIKTGTRFILSLLLGALLVFNGIGDVFSQAGTGILISPASSTATTCADLTIAVRVENVTALYAYSIQLSFTPGSLQILELTNGGFLDEGFYEPTNGFNNNSGTISFGMTQMSPSQPKNGSGDLIHIRLRATSAGASVPFSIISTSTLVNWPDVQAIPYSGTNGVVLTDSCAPTDISLSNNIVAENLPGNTLVGTLFTVDPDAGDTFTYSLVENATYPDNAFFQISGSQLRTAASFNYEVQNAYHIRIRTTDQTGKYYEEVFSILVTDVNDAPMANSQSVSTAEDAPLAITLTASDEDGNPLTWIVGSPAHGVLTGTAPNLTYTPAADYNGPDSFTFHVNDGTVNSNTATVSITVTPVNDAPVLGSIGNRTVNELVQLTFTATATDVDSTNLTFSLVGAPLGASIDPTTGVFTWTPTEAQGPNNYPFTVRVCDDGTPAQCDTELITVTVNEVNTAPVLGSIGNRTVNELVQLTFTATATDADIPTQALTFSLVGAPTGASINPTTGVFAWTPTEAQGPGSYTFDVCVSDGLLNDCETITVTVNEVNTAPVANSQSVSTAEDTPLAITLTASDADGNPLTWIVGSPAHGVLTGTAPNLTYTPAADYNGPDSFTFHVNDGTVNSNTATVSITVTPVNDAPVANSQSVSTAEDTPLAITLTASDEDGNPLTWIVGSPAHGVLTGTAPNLTYTPAADYNGPDSFTFHVNDGTVNSNTATVSITVTPVNDAPVANSQSVSTAEDTPLVITLTASDVDGNPLTWIVGSPAHGVLTGTVPNLTYTPAADYNGPDSFTFHVNDGTVNSNTATVSITVTPVNDAPVANSQSVSTAEDTPLVITLTASDVDGNPLTWIVGSPAHGVLTGTAPNLTYTPAADYNGPDSFTFHVNDGTVNSNTATVSITVTPVNDAPVLGSIGNRTVNELVQLTFTATATDVDSTNLTFSLVGAPTGASINPTTGVFTWTPTEAQGPGSYTFDVCVSDGTLNDCETITVTVDEVNTAPVLGSIGDRNVAETTLLTFTATATDVDVPAQALTFSLVGAPTGASIAPTTGVFTWTPTEAQGPGSYTFDVCVSDGTLSDCETITVTVVEGDVAPVLGPIGNRTVNELVQLTFTATATDADVPAQALTFSLVGAPLGASIDPTTGVFTWTPTEAQGPGSYTFDVCVSDGLLNDCETITVTVNEVNTAPVLGSIGNRTVNELVQLTFTATATDADIPAQALTFSLVGAPTGASINPTTGVFTWTPTEAQGPGSYTFDVCVSDGVLNDCETITVTVNEVNTAPVLGSIGNRTVNELVQLTFTATATDTDIPAQALTFSLVGAPTGASINPTTGVFTWTPTEAQGPGSYTFDVCVSDGLLNDCETITVTVNEVNTAPVLGSIGNRTVNELVQLTFTATATDTDIPAQALTFSLVGAPTGASINPTTGVFTWTPTEAQGPGSYTFDVCVSDGTLSDCETITVTVDEVNTAPVANSQSVSTAEDTPLAITLTASDADGNPLTWIVGSPAHGVLTGTAPNLTYTPAADYNGPDSFTFHVNDGTVNSNTATVSITVTPVNDAPVANSQSVSTAEDTPLAITLTASDVDGNPLTWIVGSPAHGVLTGTAPNLTYTPAADYNGPDSFTFHVNDGTVNSNTATVSITVTPVNDAPVLGSIGNRTVNELVQLTFTATATDVDSTNLTFSLVGAPTGASIDPTTGVFTWTPTEAQGPGSYTFDVCVSDGLLNDCETITVTVNEVNTAPVLGSIGNRTVNELVQLTFTATATDADIPAQALTFSLVGAPTGASINPTTGVFTWTPTEAQGPGSYTFDVCVSDGTLSDCETITVTVVEGDVAPVLDPIGNRTVNELVQLTFTATATDTDIPAQALTFSLVGAPTGASINPTTGVFTWTPTEAQGPGSYTFDVCVSDGTLSDCETITVTVNEVNTAPVLGSIGNRTVNELVQLTFTATATDADIPVQALTFSLVGAPTGASINPTTGVFTWTPTEAQGPGSYTFDVCVSDGTLNDCETITVTVDEVNVAPVANSQSVSTAEDTPLAITLSATDTDGNPLTWSFTQPTHGVLTGTAPDLTYTPELNYHGQDSFTFFVNDGQVDSNIATVTITVTPVNDPPVAVDDFYETWVNTTLPIDAIHGVLANDSEVDGDGRASVLLQTVEHGSLTLYEDGSFVYIPENGFIGEDHFIYQFVTYPSGSKAPYTDEALVTIRVIGFHLWLPIITR